MAVFTTEAQVANVALGLAGSRIKIDSLQENLPEAEACLTHFAMVAQTCLSDFHWPFAKKIEPLALLSGESSTHWGYCYALPTSCLVPRKLEGPTRNPGAEEPIPFSLELRSNNADLMLCTDLQNARLEFTFNAPPALWPPHFCQAVGYALAVPLAATLRAQPQLIPALEQIAALRLRAAAAVEQNKHQRDPEPPSEFVTVR